MASAASSIRMTNEDLELEVLPGLAEPVVGAGTQARDLVAKTWSTWLRLADAGELARAAA